MTDSPSPEELAAMKARARAERRARQTVPNLVGSLIASLAIVLALVAVVARPDQPTLQRVDYLAVAEELADDVPGALIAPLLDETWWSNRADLRVQEGVSVWTVGLISSSGDFVEISQAFGEPDDTSGLLPAEGERGIEVLPGPEGTSWTWSSIDLSETSSPGNTPHILVSHIPGSTLVVGGSSESASLLIAATIQAQYPELFGGSP